MSVPDKFSTHTALDDEGLAIQEWSEDYVEFLVSADHVARGQADLAAAVLIAGSTVLLGLIAGAGIFQGGVGVATCPGLLWLFIAVLSGWIWYQIRWSTAPVLLKIDREVVSLKRNLGWSCWERTYSFESDLIVDWYVADSGETDREPTCCIEVAGCGWALRFGERLTREVQKTLVRNLREHVGQIFRSHCPACGAELFVRDVEQSSGRQRCRSCGWVSRGRRVALVRSRNGELLLPPLPHGLLQIQLATPEELVLAWGAAASSWLVLVMMLVAAGLFLLCLFTVAIVPVGRNPQQAADFVPIFWLAVIGVGLLVVVLLHWQRHYRQTTTLTSTCSRRDMVIERSIGGFPVHTWISLEGGYVDHQAPLPALAPAEHPIPRPWDDVENDLYVVGGRGERGIGLGRRLNRLQRRWLIVVLNRFFGTPIFGMVDGKPYPETCPLCGRILLPENISTRSGVIYCVGSLKCLWNSGIDREGISLETLRATQKTVDRVVEYWRGKMNLWRKFWH